MAATLTKPTRAQVWEDGGATLMARMVGNDGSRITQASLSTISYKLYDESSATPTVTSYTATCAIASCVFDTLQTDDRWSEDALGYNFRDTLAATTLATGGHRFRAEYKFEPVAGEDFWAVFELTTVPVRSS